MKLVNKFLMYLLVASLGISFLYLASQSIFAQGNAQSPQYSNVVFSAAVGGFCFFDRSTGIAYYYHGEKCEFAAKLNKLGEPLTIVKDNDK